MKVFAIELSSRIGSIAIVEDGQVVAEKRWEENFKNRQQLFDAMAALGQDWDAVDVFAVGRGPGAFSGMRIAFSVANALAAPAGKPVYALNSGTALAAQCGAARTVVVGDARRSKVWAGRFEETELDGAFELLGLDDFRFGGFVPEGALVASPDQDRLAELLGEFTSVGEPVFPTAGKLGERVCARLGAGIESEPLEPLYMHPPVFVAPRFPA